MDHNEFKEWMTLYYYEELSGPEKEIFENHLGECALCSTEYNQFKAVMKEINNVEQNIVNQDLLFASRQKLSHALRNNKSEKESRGMLSVILDFFKYPRLAFSLGAALIMGFIIGYFVFSSSDITELNGSNNYVNVNDDFLEGDRLPKISNLNFIDADAGDGEIEIEFEAARPVRLKGSVNDPVIQSVLAYSMLNNQNPGSRLNSVNAIHAPGQMKLDVDTRNALLTVLLTDPNPGVRLEALKVLRRLPYDQSVKQAFLTVLTSDTTSGMRIEAINALSDFNEKGLSFSQEELDLFKKQFSNDENNYIKFVSRTILQEYN